MLPQAMMMDFLISSFVLGIVWSIIYKGTKE